MIVAYSLNDEYHDTMRTIFDVDDPHVSTQLNLKYPEGSVKKIERCQAKSDRKFPNTTCIVDFLRCSMSFTDPQSMLNATKILKNKVGFEDNDDNDRNGLSLKKILKYV